MSELLLHFRAPNPRDMDPEQMRTIAILQTMAQLYIETTYAATNETPEESHAYDVVLDNIATNMRRIIRNAMNNWSDDNMVAKIDGYHLAQLIYLFTGRNAEFE